MTMMIDDPFKDLGREVLLLPEAKFRASSEDPLEEVSARETVGHLFQIPMEKAMALTPEEMKGVEALILRYCTAHQRIGILEARLEDERESLRQTEADMQRFRTGEL